MGTASTVLLFACQAIDRSSSEHLKTLPCSLCTPYVATVVYEVLLVVPAAQVVALACSGAKPAPCKREHVQ
jgi:hypothetical protein